MADKKLSALLADSEDTAPDGTEAVFIVNDPTGTPADGATTIANLTKGLSAASTTAQGAVELATGAETNTGTDATRAVTPDGLDDWTGSAQITTVGDLSSGSIEGTAVKSTGEAGGNKFLREDGDGTSSWQSIPGGGDLLAANNLSDVANAATSLSNLGGIGAATTDTLTNKTFDANGTGNSLSNVDVADLANGTDGELITWDAAGAPATVAAGTATHVLTSNGPGAAPTFQAPAGGGGGQTLYDRVVAASGGDHTTLSAALTAASAGETIFVRSGTYVESSNISSALDNITIIGENRATTIIDCDSGVTFGLSGDGVQVRNITIDTLSSASTISGSDHVWHNVHWKVSHTAQALNMACSLSQISDCYFENTSTGTMTVWGFRFNGNEQSVSNCRFEGALNSSSGSRAIVYSTSTYSSFTGCSFYGHTASGTDAFLFNISGANTTVTGSIFHPNSNTAPRACVKLGSNYITFSGNTMLGSLAGIVMDNAFRNTVTGNTIRVSDNAAIGIDIDGSASGEHSITGNSINSDAASPTGDGIDIAAGDYTVVSGNNVGGFDVGVQISASTVDKAVVVGNSLSQNTTALSDSGTGTVSGNNSS